MHQQLLLKQMRVFQVSLVALMGHILRSDNSKIMLMCILIDSHASLVLQGIVNDNLEFINCYAGEVGSLHDATIFGNSPIGQSLQSRMPENYHLLVSSAYPLSVNLMTPYKDNGHLTRDQIT